LLSSFYSLLIMTSAKAVAFLQKKIMAYRDHGKSRKGVESRRSYERQRKKVS
jgi:hypothetical protein